MITFKCDLCGGEAIVRARSTRMDDFYGRSLTLPEVVYEGVHIAFMARKIPKETNPAVNLTSFMKRDDELADLCRECLSRALERGREVTREELEAVAVTP